MKDWIAERLYLSAKRRGLGKQLILGVWQLQQWAVLPPTLLIRLINRGLLPRLVSRGERVWSTKMFDDQLKRGGLL